MNNKKLSISVIRRFIPTPVIIVFALSLIVFGLFTQTHNSFAAPTASGKNPVVGGKSLGPTDAARSWLYYNMLSYCARNNNLYRAANFDVVGNSRIKLTDAQKGLWFDDALATRNKPLGNYFLSTAGDSSIPSCSGENSSWIIDAINFWGYTDGTAALLDFGAVEIDGELTGNGPGGRRIKVETLQTAIEKKLYGGQNPSLSKAQEYIFYRHSFFASCMAGKTESITSTAGLDLNFVYMITMIDNQGVRDTELFTTYLSDTFGQNSRFLLFNDSGGTSVSKTCTEMVDIINADADAYQTEAASIPGGDVPTFTKADASGSDSKLSTCETSVTGLGWIICPLITGMSELDDAMWKSVKALLNVSPLNQQGGETIYAAWGSIRSIANVLFVIFFLIIIFSQLTGVGITNYGVKKMLPKIIIAAILVNISYTIVQISVDLSNIIGSSLYTLIISLTPPVTYGWVDAVDLLEAIGASGAVAGIGIVGIIGVGGIGAAFWLLVPLALMAALGLVVAFLTLMFRQAAIPVLAIMAPLAFVAYLLPNTESLYQKWYKFLIGMLMMYPLAALVFGGAQFAGAVIIGNGENFWSLVTGLIIMALPLFSLPFLARQGGPMLSGLNGALTGMAQRARAPLNNWGRGRAAESRAAYLAADPNMRDNGHRRSFTARFTRNRAKRLDNARKTRAQDMKTDESRRESQWAESTRGRRGGGEGALDRAKQAGTTAERIKKETDARYDSSAVGMASADRLSEATKKAKAVENAATTRASNTGQGVTLDEELKRGELQTQGDTLRTASRVANDATPGGGIDLHQDLGEAQGRAAVDTQDIAHRFAVSGAGMALEDEQGAAELVARADKANTSYRTESDPTLLTIKLDAAGSEAMLKGAQAQTAQVVTEASSEGGRASVEAALGVLPGTSAEVTTLQTAQRTSDVATAATTEAQRQVTEEYQEAVAPRTPIGTPVPVTDTTRAAAGIGGLNARQRQQAKATSATSSRDEEDITARTTLVRSRSSSTTLISEAATEFTTAHSANDTVGISTATRILATSGGPGRAQLAQVADTVIPPGDISDATVRFKQELVAAGIVDRDAALGQFAIDPTARSLTEIRMDPATYQGQTPTQIARQSYEALHQAVVVHNAITYADAQATLTGPANVDLDDDRRALLRSIPP